MTKPNTGIAEASVVWAISYLFFLFNLAENFSASHDSINYLYHIVKADHLFHQHHLLYHFFAHYWMQLWQTVIQVKPYYLVEAFTALWGSSSLAVCFLFFRNRFQLTMPLAISGLGAIAFSFGFWFYTVNIEVYMPPIFFILLCLYIITRQKIGRYDVLLVGLLHSAAILFHQANILLVPVILYWLFQNRKSSPLFISIARYVAPAFVLVAGTYFIAGWIIEGKNTVDLFSNWVLGYTIGHGYWRPLGPATPLHVIAGIGRAFIGGHFIFQLPATENFIEAIFSSRSLRDEIFLSQNISVFAAWMFTIISLFLILMILILAVRFVTCYRKMGRHRKVLSPMLLTLFVYSLFFLFWEPEILDFWLLQVVLIWLMLIGMLPLVRFPFGIRNAIGVAVIAAGLFVVNFWGSIRQLKNAEGDWYYVEIKKLSAGSEDLVIIEEEWILKDYARYFTDASIIATDENVYTKEQISNAVEAAIVRQGRVYVYRDNKWLTIRSY